MKKVIILFFLLFTVFLNAQKKYTFQFKRPAGSFLFIGKVEIYRYRVYSGNTLLKDSGIVTRTIPNTTIEAFMGNIAYEVFDKRPTRVITSWTTSGSNTHCNEDIIIGSEDCVVINTGGLLDSECTTVRVSNNNVLVTSVNNSFCRKEKITLISNTCMPQQKILWYYSLDNINYESTLLQDNQVVLDLKDVNIPSTYTGPLYFKGTVSISTGFLQSIEVDSNIIIYNIIPCSPELVQQPNSSTTNCNYSEDGSFTFSVDRDLVTNEKLITTLYYKYTTGYDLAANPQREITNLEVLSDGSFGYLWSNDLSEGKYKLKYQTKKGSGGIDRNHPSWASLNASNEFTISKPVPVKFSIINTSDETCFEKSNGYINIKAEGEGERTFLYQLTKEQVVQFYNGTNWVDYLGTKANDETWFPFISKNNTKIGNLAKGNYRVKVKDSKGCFAR